MLWSLATVASEPEDASAIHWLVGGVALVACGALSSADVGCLPGSVGELGLGKIMAILIAS